MIKSIIFNKDGSVKNVIDISDTSTKERAQMVLDATDWYIIRQIETGIQCPDDIKQTRALARITLNEGV